MIIRRYTEADIPNMVEHIDNALRVTQFRDLHFSNQKMRSLLESNVKNSQFFAALATDDDGIIIGGICAAIQQFIFSYDVLSVDFFFYVTPTNRKLRVATGLVEQYVAWAKERKVKRIQLSNSMGVEIERFAMLATKLGFEQMGTIHQMRLK